MILITASRGKTGRAIIEALGRRDEPVRALSRSDAIHELRAPGVETVAGDMLDPIAMRGALDGVRAVVHIGPTFHPMEVAMGQAVIHSAVEAGVRRFVQLSVSHPQVEFLLNHQAKLRVEDHLLSSGLDYTILQPMHYMQNLDPVAITAQGVLRLPYSLSMPLGFVDLDDVAEVAAQVLTEDGHVHATYPLCGSDLLSGDDIAAMLSERAGKPVRTEELPVEDFVALLFGDSPSSFSVGAAHRLCSYYSLYSLTGNPNVLRWVLGREPSTFAQYTDRRMAA